MKKFVLVSVISLSSVTCFAQSNMHFGAFAGWGIPTGDFADTHDSGFSVGGKVQIQNMVPKVQLVLGASYLRLTDNVRIGGSEDFALAIEPETENLFTIFAGPRVGRQRGVYLLPALSANFSDGKSRLGAEFGGGVLVPIGTGSSSFEGGLTFSLVNLVGKRSGEGSSSLLRLIAGIVF